MIEVRDLHKRYGDLHAVRGLSFSLGEGEVLGFLGPNGAGKSTTMKMIVGFLAPSAGQISIFGHDVVTDPLAAQRLIGYLPEGAPSYEDMSVIGFLRFIAGVRGFKGEEAARRVDAALTRMNLDAVIHQRIETLSKGFKRRVGLAQAILHDPRVLILDEPTDGLDPNQKHQVRELIRGLAKDKIVIISTHILEEVNAVCQRAVIIADGQIVADGTPAELEARSPMHRAVHLHLQEADQAIPMIQALPGVQAVQQDANTGRITVLAIPGAQPLSAVASLVHQQGWTVDDLHAETGRLEDVFRMVTEEVA